MLVLVDGSDTSMLAIRHAILFAKNQNGRIKFVHVVAHMEAWAVEGHISLDKSFRENGAKLLEEAAALAKTGSIETEVALLESNGKQPATVIVREAADWPADILLMGSSGRGSVDRFIFGSVTEGVLRTATVPVLLLPRDDSAMTISV
ncbi:MAG: universal stress protein [Burkholderiales bacterium]